MERYGQLKSIVIRNLDGSPEIKRGNDGVDHLEIWIASKSHLQIYLHDGWEPLAEPRAYNKCKDTPTGCMITRSAGMLREREI